MDKKAKLADAIGNLLKLKGQCYLHLVDDLELSEMSLKQINYLKQFNHDSGVTTSQLAEWLDLSKPTVTEMVKKFVKSDCVYKQGCSDDKRVHYLKLTEKGEKIANIDQLTNSFLADQLSDRLDESDIEKLIEILEKIG